MQHVYILPDRAMQPPSSMSIYYLIELCSHHAACLYITWCLPNMKNDPSEDETDTGMHVCDGMHLSVMILLLCVTSLPLQYDPSLMWEGGCISWHGFRWTVCSESQHWKPPHIAYPHYQINFLLCPNFYACLYWVFTSITLCWANRFHQWKTSRITPMED